MFKVLGVSELPIILSTSRLAFLYMTSAHREDHKGAKITLWRSRSKVWIPKGFKLAQRCERECLLCKFKKKMMMDQRMGDLPIDRFDVGSPPRTKEDPAGWGWKEIETITARRGTVW